MCNQYRCEQRKQHIYSQGTENSLPEFESKLLIKTYATLEKLLNLSISVASSLKYEVSNFTISNFFTRMKQVNTCKVLRTALGT